MNVMLLVAGLLSALIGIAHSVLGERLLLGPRFERGDLPKRLGSAAFARRTVCSLLSLIGARARHFSWWVFLIISVLLWFGA